jgi:hypothetical protein
MIDESFIEKIVGLADAKIVEVDGRSYSTKGIVPVQEPMALHLGVNTLTAVSDYLKDNKDNLDLSKIMVLVHGPERVEVFSTLTGDFKRRDGFIMAVPRLRKFVWGQYMAVEQFIISLQSLFVETEEVVKVIKLVGNLTDSKTTNFNDDGVTQQVTAKVGITRVENVAVPNPVTLAPFRTFLEVKQPESDFVFRIRSAANDAPQCALFEADGGAWELQAVASVKAWLEENLPDGVTILA